MSKRWRLFAAGGGALLVGVAVWFAGPGWIRAYYTTYASKATYFKGCGHIVLDAEKCGASLGDPPAAAGSIGSGMTGEERMIYSVRRLDSLCPVCAGRRFLGVVDGFVAVIVGTPEHPGPIAEKTTISVCDLPPRELADLRHGITYDDPKEGLQLLEGLAASAGG